jgi:acyl-CoA synthetase (AMP-forming)/AMP-acid ligase II/acyl carrier protein/NAD(P)-dependent dehydrogenase (short-subunit alcohol dehydrogenase family)
MNGILKKINALTPEQRQKFFDSLEKDAQKYQIYPLSEEQERMYFLYRSAPDDPYYNIVFTLRFGEKYTEDMITKALAQLYKEQTMLRAVVMETPNGLYQCIMRSDEVPLTTILTNSAEWADNCREQISNEKVTPFDLNTNVPVRAVLVSDGRQKMLIINIHHMFADNWSVGLLSGRIRTLCSELLEKGSFTPQDAGSYYDYIRWQRAANLSADRKYWKGQLNGCPQRIHLPQDNPRKQDSTDSATAAVDFGAERSADIRAAAKQAQISVFSFLLTAFGITLSIAGGQREFMIGTPVFNRVKEEFQKTAGCFANTIAVRMDMSDAAFLTHLRNVHKTVREGLAHQSLPFNQVVDMVCSKRESGITPLYQVMFNLESESVFGNQAQYSGDDIRMEIPDENTKVQFDLICGIMERDHNYQAGFVYKKELFSEKTAAAIRDTFTAVIDAMLADVQASAETVRTECRPLFAEHDRAVKENITKALESSFTHACFDVDIHDNTLFVSYVSTDSIHTDELLTEVRGYTDLPVIFIHAFSTGTVLDPQVRSQFAVMAEQEKSFAETGAVQFERSSEYRQEWIWQDKIQHTSEETSEAEDINALPSSMEGAPLKEIPYHTLADLLLKAPAELMDNTVRTIQYGGAERVMTYAELLENSRTVAASLHERGIEKGSHAVLQISDLYDCITVFWGCQLAGIVAIPLGLPQGLEYRMNDAATNKVWNVCRLLENAYLIAGRKETANIGKYAAQTEALCVRGMMLPSDLYGDGRSGSYVCGDIDEHDIAVMLFTSGSTGVPKGVMLDHHNIIKRSQSTSERYGFDEHEISLNWMPLDHVGGLVMYHILDVYDHAPQIQVETAEILTMPLKWLKLIDRFRVTRTWAPNFAYGLVMEEQEKLPELDVDLSCCKFILNGGEAINFTACDLFLKALEEKGLAYSAMKPSWGMTETSSGILFSDRFGQIVYRNSVAVGTPNDGVKAIIADANGNPVPQGSIGRLLVAGETINRGYFRNDEENRKCFVGGGWFDTGDYAAVIDGEIVITGRNKDIVIVNGVNITCLEVEKALEELDGIMTGGIACCAVRDAETVNDRVLICFTKTDANRDRLDDMTKEMQGVLMRHFSIFADEFIALEESEMPRTAIGKIDKKLLVKKYQDHEITGQHSVLGDGIKACMFTLEQHQAPLDISGKPEYLKLDGNSVLSDTLSDKLYYSPADEHTSDEIQAYISQLAEKLDNDRKETELIVKLPLEDKRKWAAVKGYLAALSLEEPWIHTILAAADTSVSEKHICAEFNARENRYQQSRTVFFREGQRFTERLASFIPDTQTDWKKTWEGKTIVILGALGGVGSLFTEYLMKNCSGRFYLLGRISPETDDKKKTVYHKLTDIRPARFIQCDISEKGRLGSVLEDIAKEAGGIDNIVNFTGDADAVSHWEKPEPYLVRNQTIQTLTSDMMVRRSAADELAVYATKNKDTHIFILSSITAMFGGYSFGAYSAVSSEMFYRFADDPQFTVVASSKWRDIGMSKGEPKENYLLSERLGFDTLQGEKSAEYLVKLFSVKPSAVIYGLNDHNYQILKAVNVRTGTIGFCVNSPASLMSDEITEKDVSVRNAKDSMHDALEKMSGIWKQALKLNKISVDDKFFEIGGNSLKSINLISRINDAFGTELTVVDLFENPTVRQLTERTAQKGGVLTNAPEETDVSEKMRDIWKQALKLNELSADEKFFEIGGNSLKSINLISRINDAFGTELTVVDLFENPTVRQLSRKIGDKIKSAEVSSSAVKTFDL